MTKQQLISITIIIGAFLDQFYGFLLENSGILNAIGLPDWANSIIMLGGLIWAAYNRSVVDNDNKEKAERAADGLGGSNPPADPDDK